MAGVCRLEAGGRVGSMHDVTSAGRCFRRKREVFHPECHDSRDPPGCGRGDSCASPVFLLLLFVVRCSRAWETWRRQTPGRFMGLMLETVLLLREEQGSDAHDDGLDHQCMLLDAYPSSTRSDSSVTESSPSTEPPRRHTRLRNPDTKDPLTESITL